MYFRKKSRFSKVFLSSIIFSILFSSCNFLADIKDLGDGYYLDQDQILYSKKNKYDGFGHCVIPSRVMKINYDDNYIIVSSLDKKNKPNFWVIEKSKSKQLIREFEENEINNMYIVYSNVLGPLDSAEFQKQLRIKQIQLDFEQ
jgi:hypothetical protein